MIKRHTYYYKNTSLSCKASLLWYNAQKILNSYLRFFKNFEHIFWRKGITYYHPEKNNISAIVNNDIETQALLSFDAHIEQNEYSWWLRVISKK